MAATFVVEDGTAKTNSNSYLSVADLQSYWENHGNPDDISGATDAALEEALRIASQWVDLEYGSRYKGKKYSSDQAMKWPRYDVWDDDGYEIDTDVIPQALKDAVSEAAYRQLTVSGGLMADLSDPAPIISYSISVGPISEKTDYQGGNPARDEFTKIDRLMESLLQPAGTFWRG